MPQYATPTATASGRINSPIHILERCGRSNTTATPHHSPTENHATKNDTPYTPHTDAIWISGNIRYCDAPNKFQGNPVNNRA